MIDNDYIIIVKYDMYSDQDKPVGIRNSGGYILFFTEIHMYPDQKERYLSELALQRKTADYLLNALNKMETTND